MASANAVTPGKLRSRLAFCAMLRDQVASTEAVKRLPITAPRQFRLPRIERGALNDGAKSETFGALLANTVPFVPSAQVVGMVPGSAR